MQQQESGQSDVGVKSYELSKSVKNNFCNKSEFQNFQDRNFGSNFLLVPLRFWTRGLNKS